MKAKTIKAVLRKKIDEWTETIEDERVRALAEENTIVTGGAIASMLLNEEVNDFDLYFRTKETAKALADYYVARFNPGQKKGIPFSIYVEDTEDRIKIVIKSAGIASETQTDKPYEYFEASAEGAGGAYVGDVMNSPGAIEDANEEAESKAQAEEGQPKYRPVFMSTNAITLSHKIQVVLRFFGEPDVIHENYDFVHCTNYWKSWDDDLVLRPAALEALLAKDLRYVGSKYPLASIFRLRKFIKRGWTVNAGQILKMVLQTNELDLTDYTVLQDQLTGVDCAYFTQVLSRIKDGNAEKISCAYLVEIIDRMF